MGSLQQTKPYHRYRQDKKNGLWAEIRKRRVFPSLGLYLAFGFLVLEGIDQLNGHGAIPDGVYWFSLILYLFGIQGTIFLAWFHGERGPQKPQPVEVWLHGSLVVAAGVTSFFAIPDSADLPANHTGTYRLAIDLPTEFPMSLPTTRGFPFTLSPDGQRLVYVSRRETGTELVSRRLGEFEFHSLPETDGARQPFFSPDGSSIGYFANGKLMRIPVDGGQPVAITEIQGLPQGASWGPNDTILISLGGAGLRRVSASGGVPTPLPRNHGSRPSSAGNGSPPPGTTSEHPVWPDILPDGNHALVSYGQSIGVLTLSTGEVRTLRDGWQGRYLTSGYILYSESGGKVSLVPFDAEKLEITGPSTSVLEDVFRAPAEGGILFAVSATGTLVYVRGGLDRALILVDRTGKRSPLTEEKRGYRWPRFDPQGHRLVVAVDPVPSDLWILDLDRESAHRITTGAHHVLPTWSPDGRHLAFSSGSVVHLWEVWNESEPVRARGAPDYHYPLSWSPGGKVLALNKAGTGTGLDIVLLRLDEGLAEEERYQPFLTTPADEFAPQFSPSGRWVAYTSNATGQDEVYVRPYPGPDPRYPISHGGGRDALWAKDGNELFYRKGDSVMAVKVAGETNLITSPAEVLFIGNFDFTQMLNWDVSEDGKFVMVEDDPSVTRQFQVVVNWLREIETPGSDVNGG